LDSVRKEVRSAEGLLDEEERQASSEAKRPEESHPPFGAATWRQECKVRVGKRQGRGASGAVVVCGEDRSFAPFEAVVVRFCVLCWCPDSFVLCLQQPVEEGLPIEYCPCKTLAEWAEYVQRAPLMVRPLVLCYIFEISTHMTQREKT
jgi:hypothetical protein